MKNTIFFLFFFLFPYENNTCIENFPIKDNFSEVVIKYNGKNIYDVYEICISKSLRNKNALNLKRRGGETLWIHHDDISKLIFYYWNNKFEMHTKYGVFSFKTTNIETRDKIKGYFPKIPVDVKFW